MRPRKTKNLFCPGFFVCLEGVKRKFLISRAPALFEKKYALISATNIRCKTVPYQQARCRPERYASFFLRVKYKLKYTILFIQHTYADYKTLLTEKYVVKNPGTGNFWRYSPPRRSGAMPSIFDPVVRTPSGEGVL